MWEAYSVGIRLKLLDSVTAGLTGLASHFMAFNRHIGTSQKQLSALEGQLQRLKVMGLIGGAAVGLGVAGLYAFKGPIEEAKAWAQEAARFTSLGFGQKTDAEATLFARGMKTIGTSAVENLTLLSDAMAQFKDLSKAEIAAPIMARMQYANEAVFGSDAGSANARQFQNMLQLIDMRGGIRNTAAFATQANFIQQAIAGSRGRVDAQAMLQAARTGGVAVSQLSDQAFYLGLEPIIREFGGARTGTGLMSIYQNLVQSRGTITAQQELYRLGLLDPRRVTFNTLGMLKKALPGAFRGSEVLEQQGPLALLEQVLLPAFAAHGITGDAAVIRELGMILGNRTGSSLMSRVYQQRATFAMQSAANSNAMNIDQLAGAAANTPNGKILALHKQWHDALLNLGTTALPIAIKAVTGLTTVLAALNRFMTTFPRLTSGLEVAFGVLSALVAVGGAITLATAGFRALGLALAAARLASLGTMLIGVLTPVSWVVAAIAAVTAACAGIYEFYHHRQEIENWFGRVFNVGPGAAHTGATGHWDVVGSPGAAPVVVHTTINMDGRKVAEAVTKHQARAMNAPQTGIGGFSSAMAPMPAGGTGSW